MIARWTTLELARQQRRTLGLLAFGGVFIAAAAAARLLSGGEHVEFDVLMQTGGYSLVSALLLTGWLAGRFPIIAAFVLSEGIFSRTRDTSLARLLEVRARSPLGLFALRVLLAMLLALAVSFIVLPVFDLIMLGNLPGEQLFVLALGYVLAYASLTALLSTFTRGDAWIAAFLMFVSMIWHAVLRSGSLASAPPLLREAVTVLLPPHGALLQLEAAFAADLAIPWSALLYVGVYAALALLLAGVIAQRREL